MPKNGFPMPTAKNRFQILNLHPKKHAFKKNMVKKTKKITIVFSGLQRVSGSGRRKWSSDLDSTGQNAQI